MCGEVRFREDGTIRLMQLTDLHYSDDPGKAVRTLALQRSLLEAEKPDLVILTGDIVYGEHNIEQFSEAIAPLLESGIPWIQVFGNHDTEPLGNRKEMFESILSLPGYVGSDDPSAGDGVGNFFLPIRGKNSTQWYICGIDSGGNATFRPEGWPTRRQIQWYVDTIKSLERANGKDFSVLTFMHMPIQEHETLWRYERCYGSRWENVSESGVNSGFFGAMLAAGHTQGLFVGHDHCNSYWGRMNGIALGYGRYSGFGSYGPADYLRGARMFQLAEDDISDFSTWERLEYGILLDEPWVKNPVETREEYLIYPR